MRDGKRFRITAAACAALLLCAQPALAQGITYTGQPCPLPVSSGAGEEAGVAVTVNVSQADVLGVTGEYAVLLLEDAAAAGGQTDEEDGAQTVSTVGYVALETFTELTPGFDLSLVPNAEGIPTLTNGSSGEAVQALQEQLISLDYLQGEADGRYGPNTAGGVNALKAACGLPADGQADAVTQWLAGALTGKKDGSAPAAIECVYPPVYREEDKFASIYDRTEADLSGFLTPDWSFQYDVFEGTGSIQNGTKLGSLSFSDTEIDQLDLDADLLFAVVREETGEVLVYPAVHVATIGAYCPYLQTIQIRSGDEVAQISLSKTSRGLEDIRVTEDDLFPLTVEAAQLAAGAEGELTLRLNGTGKTYEMSVPAQQAAAFAEAGVELAISGEE